MDLVASAICSKSPYWKRASRTANFLARTVCHEHSRWLLYQTITLFYFIFFIFFVPFYHLILTCSCTKPWTKSIERRIHSKAALFIRTMKWRTLARAVNKHQQIHAEQVSCIRALLKIYRINMPYHILHPYVHTNPPGYQAMRVSRMLVYPSKLQRTPFKSQEIFLLQYPSQHEMIFWKYSG